MATVDDDAGVDTMLAVHDAVFGPGTTHPSVVEAVRTALALQPRPIEAVLAWAGESPSRRGGSSSTRAPTSPACGAAGRCPAWRGRGVFRALVGHRAVLARDRGFRYLQVDALPTSRPILERMGFQPLAETTPWVRLTTRRPGGTDQPLDDATVAGPRVQQDVAGDLPGRVAEAPGRPPRRRRAGRSPAGTRGSGRSARAPTARRSRPASLRPPSGRRGCSRSRRTGGDAGRQEPRQLLGGALREPPGQQDQHQPADRPSRRPRCRGRSASHARDDGTTPVPAGSATPAVPLGRPDRLRRRAGRERRPLPTAVTDRGCSPEAPARRRSSIAAIRAALLTGRAVGSGHDVQDHAVEDQRRQARCGGHVSWPCPRSGCSGPGRRP